jgi:hypothetical protein
VTTKDQVEQRFGFHYHFNGINNPFYIDRCSQSFALQPAVPSHAGTAGRELSSITALNTENGWESLITEDSAVRYPGLDKALDGLLSCSTLA